MEDSNYQMPPACVGDIVLWHGDGDAETDPSAAVVTAVGDRGLTVSVIMPMSYNIQPSSGVRHVTDPRNLTLSDLSAGTWQTREEWTAAQAEKHAATSSRRAKPRKEEAAA